ncbi:hypothetical protein FNAPI_6769 [Fusarium napiforme]|uniref:Uncharacterized protein n=1 Tax=Fusarium napiforme TaxID=42672 RepID=A0A8H5N6F3_9HYPO|nr:hypothetical protein FNAPI_6769 [Fusarium napiforme]
MSETWNPDHALPGPYLSYKRQACDNENRPIDELWNERFREEFSKWGRSPPVRAQEDRMGLLGHSFEDCQINEQSRNGWAARAAAAYPNANIWRGRPREGQDDAAIIDKPDTNDDTEEPMVTGRPTQTAGEAQSACYKSQSKAKCLKPHARILKQHLRALMGKKIRKVGVAKRQSNIETKSPRSDEEIKKLKHALRRRNRAIQQDEETIRLLKSKLHEKKEYDEGCDERCRSTTLSPSRWATLSPDPASSPTLSTGPGTFVDNLTW